MTRNMWIEIFHRVTLYIKYMNLSLGSNTLGVLPQGLERLRECRAKKEQLEVNYPRELKSRQEPEKKREICS